MELFMKTRVISSLIGLVVLILVLLMFNTIVLNIAVAVISLIAVYELLCATGCRQYRVLFFLSMTFAALVPFFPVRFVAQNLMVICYVYVLAVFLLLLKTHEHLRVEQVAISVMCSLLIPFSLTTLVYQRDSHGATLGIFYVLISLGSAWLSDTGAYFAGRAFGRRKLAPQISPKKTVEGAIGGAVFAAFTMLFVAWLYALMVSYVGYAMDVFYLRLLCMMPALTAVSILGDLSASVIKRQFGVKDYGSIMPGHGGVMDRFDSALTVAPLVYLISQWIPLAQLVVK
jgi:phosphatidate cytidylyltransferase